MEGGFRGLKVWQRSYELGLRAYEITRGFPRYEQYGLMSQIRRAAISISVNIAEGYERRYHKEYIQFLMIAKGSIGELETLLLFSRDLSYISKQGYDRFEAMRVEVIKLLKGLINSLSQPIP